jgi:nucleoside-diphosphate-sugar epimerase
MKTIALTGATGFVGSHILIQLLNKGYIVRANIRNEKKAKGLLDSIKNVVQKDFIKNIVFFKADFSSYDNWEANFNGCDALIHVASPLGSGKETKEELIKIAKEGTLLVFHAAKNVGITRIIMTSSQAASTPETSIGNVVLDEEFWSDLSNPELDPYRISKIESEKAAWEFAKENNLDLTTILPGAIFGPILSKESISSSAIIGKILNGTMPAIKVNLEICDVRDVGNLHILALENSKAINQRYLAASQIISISEIGNILKDNFKDYKKIKTKEIPNFMVKIIAKIVPAIRTFVPMLSRQYKHTTKKAEKELSWTQHSPKEIIIDTAKSLIELKII